jgi:hypothetical protein
MAAVDRWLLRPQEVACVGIRILQQRVENCEWCGLPCCDARVWCEQGIEEPSLWRESVASCCCCCWPCSALQPGAPARLLRSGLRRRRFEEPCTMPAQALVLLRPPACDLKSAYGYASSFDPYRSMTLWDGTRLPSPSSSSASFTNSSNCEGQGWRRASYAGHGACVR